MAVLRQSIEIGSTGTELVTAFNSNATKSNLRIYNVEDYGAVHDGVTDDTVAIQAAITAVNTAKGGIIYFPNGVYVINGALIGTTGGTTYNSQLTIPYITGSSQLRHTFHFLGESSPELVGSTGTIPAGTHPLSASTGVVWKSTITGSGTNPSVLCCGNYLGANNWSAGNAHTIIVENISIQVVKDGDNKTTIGGINFRGGYNAIIKNVTMFQWNADLIDSGIPIAGTVGLAMPLVNCDLINYIENVHIGGFETGTLLGEHVYAAQLNIVCCKYAIQQDTNYHTNILNRVGVYWCNNAFYFSGGSSYLKVQLQMEYTSDGKWYDNSYSILDDSNYGHGEIHYNCVTAGVGFDNSNFSKSGGTNLQCIPTSFASATSFTITGARNSPEAALKNLITALAAKGIIVDSTTET